MSDDLIVDLAQKDIDLLVNVIKSLFDSKFDSFVYKDHDGHNKNTVLLENIKVNVNDEDYEEILNKILMKNLKGLKIKEEPGEFVTLFSYKGKEVLMCQYVNLASDSVYFEFTLY